MTASCGRIGALVMRMQGHYFETPGLTLTLRDAQRRFGVDETTLGSGSRLRCFLHG